MFKKLKNRLTHAVTDAEYKKKRLIYGLILDFSPLPLIITATAVYINMRGESALLLDGNLDMAYLAMFTELIAVSLLSVLKRFYFTKYLLIAVAVQMTISALVFRYTDSYFRIFMIAVFAAATAVLNLCMLYGYKNMTVTKRQGDGEE